jgi:hypothetical protein
MSNSEEEPGISDDQLPEDLQPSEDNPLAEGLDEGETAGDLLEEGKDAEVNEGDQGDEE